MIQVGRKPPAFTLANQDGEKVRLADLTGRWIVLYFYPKDDTPGCTTQACDFSAGIRGFGKLDATVLGCSPDSPESHRAFIAKHKLKVDLLSDPGHRTMEKYGAWGEKNMYGKIVEGVIRSTVIIDPDGRVAHHYKRARAKGHAEAVTAKLDELQGT
ncbi:MAG: peroxiredoxin [Phycisphaerae bacterium]|nr:peroxiredoxin [Phycisphaerae bacterium]